MTQEDTALQAAWEEWLAAHPDRSTAGPVYRPGFEAGWLAQAAVARRLREAVMLHHEATVLARTVGVETHEAWGMRCPVCAAALATPPSEEGQS